MSFRDMTFCTYHEDCTLGHVCPRALTTQVQHDAIMWWGSDDAPISVFIETPHCFESKETHYEMERSSSDDSSASNSTS